MMLFLLRVRVSEHKQKSGPKFIEAAFEGVAGPRNTISRASLHCRRIETRNYVTPSPLNLSTNGRAATLVQPSGVAAVGADVRSPRLAPPALAGLVFVGWCVQRGLRPALLLLRSCGALDSDASGCIPTRQFQQTASLSGDEDNTWVKPTENGCLRKHDRFIGRTATATIMIVQPLRGCRKEGNALIPWAAAHGYCLSTATRCQGLAPRPTVFSAPVGATDWWLPHKAFAGSLSGGQDNPLYFKYKRGGSRTDAEAALSFSCEVIRPKSESFESSVVGDLAEVESDLVSSSSVSYEVA